MASPTALLRHDRARRKRIRSALAFGKRHGMTNHELAAYLGIHVQTVVGWKAIVRAHDATKGVNRARRAKEASSD